MKCEEMSSTQNNVDETEEKKNFHVEKIDASKETTDDTVKKFKKRNLKLMADLEENKKKNRSDKI